MPTGDEDGSLLLIDSHDNPVADEVLALFSEVCASTGPLPTLIEWDNDVPEWPRLVAEAERARGVLMGGTRHA